MTGRRRSVRKTAGRPGAAATRFVIVTGLSGAGKSHALRALEDLGFFCVDNLPTRLIPTFANLMRRTGDEIAQAAAVVDVREGALLDEFPAVYRRLRRMPGLHPQLIFLEASDAALVRRFSETRRPHPLAPNRSPLAGIRRERARLRGIRRIADRVVDTSALTVHDLRRRMSALMGEPAGDRGLVLTLLSFGYKHGVPLEADLVLDVRFLPNPHFVASLRHLTGRERRVARFVARSPVTREFVERTLEYLRFLVPRYVAEGKRYLTVAVGCTGGRHRSVVLANALARRLRRVAGVRVRVEHRDIHLG